MDAYLRNLKRQAEITDDSEAWQRYARALERSFGLAPPKIFALLSDGTTHGDSIWHGSSYIPYEEGDDKRTLMRRHLLTSFQNPCEDCIDYALNSGICWDACGECDSCNNLRVYNQSDHRQSCDADVETYAGCVPTVAWIIDEGIAMSLDIMDHDCCTDSAFYQLNTSLKTVAQENAIKTLVFSPGSNVPQIKTQDPEMKL